MNIDMHADTGNCMVSINEVINVISVINEKILTYQIRIFRYLPVRFFLTIKSPMHFFNEVGNGHTFINLRLIDRPILEIPYHLHVFAGCQLARIRRRKDDIERARSDQLFLYMLSCFSGFMLFTEKRL